MASILWKTGIVFATIIFGVKIGLALGFSGFSKRIALSVVAVYSLVFYGLNLLAKNHLSLLHGLVTSYSYLIFLAMSVLIFGTGLYTLREWRVHGKNKANTCCLALAVPCPCCYASVLMAIGFASPVLGVSLLVIGKFISLIFALTIVLTYFLADGIVRVTKKPYPVLLGNLMILTGFYFLVSAMIMPNIGSLKTNLAPLTLPSFEYLFFALGAVFLFGLYGAYKSKKKGLLR